MARFLIACVSQINNVSQPFIQEIFKVSSDCTPENASIPENTIYFTFANADVNSTEEFTDAFITVKMGNLLFVDCIIPVEYEDNKKRYWIGEIRSVDGTEVVYNKHTDGMILTSCLNENDEVINL